MQIIAEKNKIICRPGRVKKCIRGFIYSSRDVISQSILQLEVINNHLQGTVPFQFRQSTDYKAKTGITGVIIFKSDFSNYCPFVPF
jgi:hypothetical protein